MTDVSAPTPAPVPAPRPEPSAPAGPVLGQDAFLKLLVTQMQTQDPTSPMDSSEYIAQLATFSAVEQATQTNNKLDALLTASLVTQAGSVIGRTLTGPDGTGGQVASVSADAGSLTAHLTDGTRVPLDGRWELAP